MDTMQDRLAARQRTEKRRNGNFLRYTSTKFMPILMLALGFATAFILWLDIPFLAPGTSYGLSLSSADETTPQPLVQQESSYTLAPIVAGLVDPVGLAFLPNGDVLIAERGSGLGVNGLSRIRLVRNRNLDTEPVLTLSTNVEGTSGIHGIEVDPNVNENGYIYVYYALGVNAAGANGPTKNRLSRFTLNLATGGAESTSELILLDGLRWSVRNNGGSLHFGNDGLLYLGTGDTEQPQHARKLDRYSGKILRIRPTDGGYAVPPDNPFVNEREAHPEVFAYGFHNPIALARTENGTEIYVADQGEAFHEEINWLQSGGHYGWPFREGECPRGQDAPEACVSDERYIDPIGAYRHGTFGSSISGLAYINSSRYPIGIQDHFAFVDNRNNFVGSLEPAAGSFAKLLEGTGALRQFASHNDYLYTLNASTGELALLYYNLEELTGVGSMQPSARLTAEPLIAVPPAVVTLAADSSTDPKGLGLSYQWSFGDGSPNLVTESPVVTHTYASDGIFTAVVSVVDLLGDVSEPAAATVSLYGGELPDIMLENSTEPGRDLYYSGDRFTFRAERESGVTGLNQQSPYRWRIDLHHTDEQGTHVHPLSNVDEAEGLIRLRLTDEHNNDPDIFYRFHLTMMTEEGLEIESYRDLKPELATLSINAQPTPANLLLNQTLYQQAFTRTVIAGQTVEISAAATTLSNGGIGEFAYWHLFATEWPSFAASLNETIIYSRTATIDVSPLNTNITAHYEYAQPAVKTYLPLLSGGLEP